jgi:hypothetical protein
MAVMDADKFKELLAEVEFASEDAKKSIDAAAEQAGAFIPDGNKPIDEGAMANTDHECPKCGFKW